MTRLRGLSASLLLAATLAGAAHAQAQPGQPVVTPGSQRAVLSGETGELDWTLYGPGQMTLNPDARNTLVVSAPPGTSVVGAKYEEGAKTAILAFRAPDATLGSVVDFYQRQLVAQGFVPGARSSSDNRGEGTYARRGDRIVLQVNRGEGDVYRVRLNMQAVAGQSGQMQQNQVQQNQAAAGQPAPGQNPGQANPNVLQQLERQDGVVYVLYGPVELVNLRVDPSTVNLAVPPAATVVETARSERDVAAVIRTELTLEQLREYYLQLLRRQGFEPMADFTLEADRVATDFRRGETYIEWSAEREGENTFRVVFDFAGVTGE